MDEISCNVCIDLMPLVHDGVASEESKDAVVQHIAHCPECKALFEGELPKPDNDGGMLKNMQRKVQMFCAMVMMFGILYGLMLTAGNGVFYNVLIMPAIGAVGYYLFRWNGLYLVPVLLAVTHLLTNALGLGGEYLDVPSLLLWTLIYCASALTGLLIAGLLHFAFKKETKK